MSSKALVGDSVNTIFIGFATQRPDQDSIVSSSGDQEVAVYVFSLGVASYDASNPTIVALQDSEVFDVS